MIVARKRVTIVKDVPYSEAAMFSKIAGTTVYARKRNKHNYEVRKLREKTWWGEFTSGELGIMETPKRLKKVRFGGKTWFVDTRLEEYRNVKIPWERISFNEAWKKY